MTVTEIVPQGLINETNRFAKVSPYAHIGKVRMIRCMGCSWSSVLGSG